MKMKPDELAEAFLALSPKEFDQFWRHVCFVWNMDGDENDMEGAYHLVRANAALLALDFDAAEDAFAAAEAAHVGRLHDVRMMRVRTLLLRNRWDQAEALAASWPAPTEEAARQAIAGAQGEMEQAPMTQPEPSRFTFEQQVRVAKRLQRIARLIDKELAAAGAPRMPWSLYTWGGNRAQYVSNTDRADAILAMKECIARWEEGAPEEPTLIGGGSQ